MTAAPPVTASEPREAMDFDVVIVGAGPAGLAAAIRLRMAAARDRLARRLLAATMTIFIALLILAAFFPAVLATPIGPGRVTTIAWPLGAAVIIIPWILTVVFVRQANATGAAMDAVVRRALA